MDLTVIICTYNPQQTVFDKVLEGLKRQSLERHLWELIIVDNCSPTPLAGTIDVSWHPNSHIIVEAQPGLAHARVAGMEQSRAPLIVFVDDDNIMDPQYLENSLQFHQAHPGVGCFGGRSLPVFETAPPSWFAATGINLGCQDYGPERYISNYAAAGFRLTTYPSKAPIGTGMVILKKAFQCYLHDASQNPERMKLGRKGASLSSGEDNDIILSLVKNGYEIAYVPELVVHHLIPAKRYSPAYLEKMAFESNRSWMKVLAIHGLNPYAKIGKWTVLPRKLRSYLVHRAWRSPLATIRWRSSCGIFQGLSEI